MEFEYIFTQEQLDIFNKLILMSDDQVWVVFRKYIENKHLYSKYINRMAELNSKYVEKVERDMLFFKRDVNFLYQPEAFGHEILKGADITEKNWFWYARILRDSENEDYPNGNFIQPTYLLKRLKPILDSFDEDKLNKYGPNNDETEELYNRMRELMKKYNI